MREEEFITKFYSCDNEEQFLKDVHHNLNCLEQKNQELRIQVSARETIINELEERIEKVINKLDNFITCCKCEKLESGSDYLHNQYWNMFENFNKQVKEILKGDKE